MSLSFAEFVEKEMGIKIQPYQIAVLTILDGIPEGHQIKTAARARGFGLQFLLTKDGRVTHNWDGRKWAPIAETDDSKCWCSLPKGSCHFCQIQAP